MVASILSSLTTLAAVAGPYAQNGQTPTAVAPPSVSVLKPLDFSGSYAIWGSTGFDGAGHIFFGVEVASNDDHGAGSAHLLELDPATGTFTDRGNVESELERRGLRRPGRDADEDPLADRHGSRWLLKVTATP